LTLEWTERRLGICTTNPDLKGVWVRTPAAPQTHQNVSFLLIIIPSSRYVEKALVAEFTILKVGVLETLHRITLSRIIVLANTKVVI
jgi:hypothetical protein